MGSGTRRTCMYPLLRKLMSLRDCTMEELAAHLGISYSSLRRKITGYQPWRLEEAVAPRKALYPGWRRLSLFRSNSLLN